MYSHARLLWIVLACSVFAAACGGNGPSWESVQDSGDRLHSVEGLNQPEAVRYDPDQDLYFVSNFNGSGSAADSNGYVSSVTADGTIHRMLFISGTDRYPMHAPRGMDLKGDTLFIADLSGVHAYNRKTGAQLGFVDFRIFDPGFLNDVVVGSDGAVYVTDTGNAAVYRIRGLQVAGAVDSLQVAPNGITLNPETGELVLAPFGGSRTFYALSDQPEPSVFTEAESGGNFDGIEFHYDRLIAASQSDSSLHVLRDGSDRVYIRLPGQPADIGIDTRRDRVAVPYIALNRVDIWQLPR